MKVKPITEHPQNPVDMPGAEKVRMRMLIGPDEGAEVFHMRQFEVDPGGHTPHHAHDYEHEVLILKGRGMVKCETGDRPCRAGDVVHGPIEIGRAAFRKDRPQLLLLYGGRPFREEIPLHEISAGQL